MVNKESLFASLHILMRAIPDVPADAGRRLCRYWYRESRCQVRTGWQIQNPFNQRNLRLINNLRAYKALYNCRDTFTDVMSALQINFFMQNEPNFPESQMNANKVLTMDYENKTLGERWKNEPKTNPIKPNPQKSVQSARAPALREPKFVVKIKYMKSCVENSKLVILFLAFRPKFLVASVAPVLVGSCLGYTVAGAFQTHLFILAMLAIMALHAGANIANDYFDHISGNDWVNQNPTPFSGGSRYIQEGILSPKAILLAALVALAVGSAIGVVIILLTQSLFILILGLIGLLGGFFYTAPPIKLGYRCIGEFVIALLFGLFPVYGSYYLQTETIDAIPLLPAFIVGVLIFLVILVNEFPDVAADAAVNKKTLVVRLGVPGSVWVYRAALVASFLIAAAMMIYRSMFFAGLFYLITLPIAVFAIKSANKEDLVKPGRYRASQITVLLHALGSLALTVGFLLQTALRNPAI